MHLGHVADVKVTDWPYCTAAKRFTQTVMSATSREGSKWEDVMFRRTVETVGNGLGGVDVGGGIWYVILFCVISGVSGLKVHF